MGDLEGLYSSSGFDFLPTNFQTVRFNEEYFGTENFVEINLIKAQLEQTKLF